MKKFALAIALVCGLAWNAQAGLLEDAKRAAEDARTTIERKVEDYKTPPATMTDAVKRDAQRVGEDVAKKFRRMWADTSKDLK